MKKRNAILMALMLLVFMMAGCSQSNEGTDVTENGVTSSDTSSSTVDGETSEKIIRISQAGGTVIDPAVAQDYSSMMAVVNLYDSLVYPDMEGNVVPMLAESWTYSDDGLEWTFKLREDAKFHDGSDLTADDVVFSANRLMTIGEGFAYLFADYLDTVEKVDDYTVTFTLKEPFAPFLSIMCRLYVVNEDLLMANIKEGSYGEFGDYGKEYLTSNDAGSGAYYCEAMKVQEKVVMAQFDDYYESWDENAPEKVEIISGTETATIRTMMSNGELEISDQWQTEEAYQALAEIDGVNVESYSNGQMLYVMLNTKSAPTDDVHIRKALAYLIDYAQVTEQLFPGYIVAESCLPSGLFGYTDALDKCEYDLEKAKEEIALSQYADSIADYPIELAWIAEVPDEEKVSLLMQAYGQQIGLTIDVLKVPWTTHVDNVAKLDTTPNACITFMTADYGEAGSLLYQRYHSATAGSWMQIEWLQDDELDNMIEESLITLDNDEREQKYIELQELALDECYGIAVAEQAEKHACVDYIEWPAIERANNGESVSTVLGYNYLFRTFKVNN